ncbi:uncharacterized protein LACBIDRAFT_321169 [Laccaria bicolor S238N-H82]|uniref:Predicted protein n=1 Tax=Laccaria bicolor (strain S238N-H82 / ATCC MYA-4686) TaxID=486041 RepID=B0CNZ7_LACBS|nr:uncharacterized protein LACBIDRAFT_321169 [Laccaria bicolor S238N-H82]EDR16025.1 predicted protein [Laccaria bicolor S238N-H82]|eukprot:XP_001874233.1 predicted protein [Laccaria bicolor S238N-H82]
MYPVVHEPWTRSNACAAELMGMVDAADMPSFGYHRLTAPKPTAQTPNYATSTNRAHEERTTSAASAERAYWIDARLQCALQVHSTNADHRNGRFGCAVSSQYPKPDTVSLSQNVNSLSFKDGVAARSLSGCVQVLTLAVLAPVFFTEDGIAVSLKRSFYQPVQQGPSVTLNSYPLNIELGVVSRQARVIPRRLVPLKRSSFIPSKGSKDELRATANLHALLEATP